MEQETDIKKIIAVAVIFFAVGFGVSWAIFGTGIGGEAQVAEEGELEGTEEMKKGTEAEGKKEMAGEKETGGGSEKAAVASVLGSGSGIAVDDQEAGTQIAIAKVVLANKGWVVIHEDRDGAPGRILGAQRFPPGEHRGAVDLLRPTVPGVLYYAVIHGDDGDDSFDFTKDVPAKDVSGNLIFARFTARSASGAGGDAQ